MIHPDIHPTSEVIQSQTPRLVTRFIFNSSVSQTVFFRCRQDLIWTIEFLTSLWCLPNVSEILPEDECPRTSIGALVGVVRDVIIQCRFGVPGCAHRP